jgi:hypothetical protein
MSKLLKLIGLAIGLTFVAIAFSGAKYVHPSCSQTTVLGFQTCTGNVQFGPADDSSYLTT